MQGIDYRQGSPVESSVASYEDAYSRYYAPFMQQYPYMLENYLVNHVFRTRFPFRCNLQGEPIDAKAQHLLMCLQYCVIKGQCPTRSWRLKERYSGSFYAASC